ncbi:MAG: MarC family protein, partial [Alphaproteobacteria bacterium]|nr:MarC family protein [Alphaproteobacteria bacterium]
AIALAVLLLAARVVDLLGVTGVNVIGRILGILLGALAIQFILDGIAASGLFAGGTGAA